MVHLLLRLTLKRPTSLLPNLRRSMQILASGRNRSSTPTSPGWSQYLLKVLLSLPVTEGIYVKLWGPGRPPGIVGIAAPMLKHASRKGFCQIYYIFINTIALCYFPDAWKVSKIIPIPKPGKSCELPTSYRPISLLSILGELLEKCIHEYLTEFLAKNRIIVVQQFGFRPGHSTIQQKVCIAQITTHELNVNRSVGDAGSVKGVRFRLARSISVQLAPGFVTLISSYLSNRHLFVNSKEARSQLYPVLPTLGCCFGRDE